MGGVHQPGDTPRASAACNRSQAVAPLATEAARTAPMCSGAHKGDYDRVWRATMIGLLHADIPGAGREACGQEGAAHRRQARGGA